MNKVNLHQLIIRSAQEGLNLQSSDGAMPPGHNGPWNDHQTPVRNTSHWALIFSYAYKKTRKTEYLQGVKNCSKYLLKKAVRPQGHTFQHRIVENNSNKSENNGLVGQAWTIEALAECGKVLQNNECTELAAKIFNIHPFNEEHNMWNSVSINGDIQSIHGTINQQIWFAAAASQLPLSENPSIKNKIKTFLRNLSDTVCLYSRGLIIHDGYPINSYIKTWVYRNLKPLVNSRHLILSKGYHSFILYGLSILHEEFPNMSIWNTKYIDDLISYTHSIRYLDDIQSNPFSYTYNTTGFEVAYFLDEFGIEYEDRINYWTREQIRRSYDFSRNLLCNGDDPETLSARIYEATRLPDSLLKTDMTKLF